METKGGGYVVVYIRAKYFIVDNCFVDNVVAYSFPYTQWYQYNFCSNLKIHNIM